MLFYIGFDSAHPIAAEVTAASMARFTGWNPIRFIDTTELRTQGCYWRNHTGNESTDFTYSRFLTPYLGNSGYATFCDGDFFWRKDPHLLYEYADGSPVKVVKHDLRPEHLSSTKMDGKKQLWYPMKNWSSLMMFNCDHEDCENLLPTDVNERDPSWLHGFKWTDVEVTESLPLEFNWLVGYYRGGDPAAVHFTDGGPWLPGYENVDYAQEWRDVQSSIKR